MLHSVLAEIGPHVPKSGLEKNLGFFRKTEKVFRFLGFLRFFLGF